ncbi:MAG: DUF3341 domain-containing protein [Bacteroidetes bacterium]|nr:DUF3341 domain-containing protein [Bacteroidota bacterium]
MAGTVTKKVIHGVYDDEVPLLEACKKLGKAGIKIKDVFTPFPIHGIDPIVGVPRTRLAICAFLYGLTGCGLATLMMWYMMVSDWPIDIGGKPNWSYVYNIPAFIPITFEATIFCAGHGMALTFLLRCMLIPGARPKNPDPRTTNDKFLIYLELTEDQTSQADGILRSAGASEVNYKGIVTEKLAY